MKKYAGFLFAAAGVAGAILRRTVGRGIDAATGFLPRGFAPNTALAVFSAAVIVCAAVIALLLPKKKALSCAETFDLNLVEFIVIFCGGAVIGAQGIYSLITMRDKLDLVFAILAFISGAAEIVFAISMKSGKVMDGSSVLYASVPLFFCFWMALTYSRYSTNPRIYMYCYEILALSAAAVSFYFTEGYLCGHANSRGAAASSLMASFFSAVGVYGMGNTPGRAIMAAVMCISVVTSVKVLGSFDKHREEPESDE